MGCSLCGCKESDTTEVTEHTHMLTPGQEPSALGCQPSPNPTACAHPPCLRPGAWEQRSVSHHLDSSLEWSGTNTVGPAREGLPGSQAMGSLVECAWQEHETGPPLFPQGSWHSWPARPSGDYGQKLTLHGQHVRPTAVLTSTGPREVNPAWQLGQPPTQWQPPDVQRWPRWC